MIVCECDSVCVSVCLCVLYGMSMYLSVHVCMCKTYVSVCV